MFFKERQVLSNLYDSHVHWMYTGQLATTWNLRDVQDPHDLLLTQPPPSYYRDSWLVGFGWDENQWPEGFQIHRKFLDAAYPETPVFLSRVDGHSSWVNTRALELLGFWPLKKLDPDVVIDQQGVPTGLLREAAHIRSLFSLPKFSQEVRKEHLKKGALIFNKAGFTHIRDMTSSLDQWQLHQKLQDELALHVEHWFSCENTEDFKRALADAQEARQTENDWMKLRGIKIFVDGSLGSHTAFLSTPYTGMETHGQMNWSDADIQHVLRVSWENNLEVALHALGDEAAHRATLAARSVYSSGVMGVLHLEHTEILRPETIQAFKSLHVRCHLQPCHWFSDSHWLPEKVGSLAKYAFPWQALFKAQVPFSFGSDAPIEVSDFFRNLQALEDSKQKGIPALSGPSVPFHQYPYKDAPSGCTTIENDKILSIRIDSKELHFT